MDYGVDVKRTVTRTCKGWDRVSKDDDGETQETHVKCGARYATKAVAPIDACSACMTEMRDQFWTIWEKSNA